MKEWRSPLDCFLIGVDPDKDAIRPELRRDLSRVTCAAERRIDDNVVFLYRERINALV